MTEQIVQLVGAVLVLGAFVLSQAKVVDANSLPYLLLNAVGAGVLAVLAYHERQWGFLLLEGVWALVSIVGLAGLARRAARVAGASHR